MVFPNGTPSPASKPHHMETFVQRKKKLFRPTICMTKPTLSVLEAYRPNLSVADHIGRGTVERKIKDDQPGPETGGGVISCGVEGGSGVRLDTGRVFSSPGRCDYGVAITFGEKRSVPWTTLPLFKQ